MYYIFGNKSSTILTIMFTYTTLECLCFDSQSLKLHHINILSSYTSYLFCRLKQGMVFSLVLHLSAGKTSRRSSL